MGSSSAVLRNHLAIQHWNPNPTWNLTSSTSQTKQHWCQPSVYLHSHPKRCLVSLQITVTDHGIPAKSTTVRVIVQVLDENDNRPLFLEKIYKIKLPERERPERERATKRDPVYRVIASDRDEGPNAEISYSIEEGDENGKFFIEPKTGLVSSKKFSSAGEYDILTVSVFLLNAQRNWRKCLEDVNKCDCKCTLD